MASSVVDYSIPFLGKTMKRQFDNVPKIKRQAKEQRRAHKLNKENRKGSKTKIKNDRSKSPSHTSDELTEDSDSYDSYIELNQDVKSTINIKKLDKSQLLVEIEQIKSTLTIPVGSTHTVTLAFHEYRTAIDMRCKELMFPDKSGYTSQWDSQEYLSICFKNYQDAFIASNPPSMQTRVVYISCVYYRRVELLMSLAILHGVLEETENLIPFEMDIIMCLNALDVAEAELFDNLIEDDSDSMSDSDDDSDNSSDNSSDDSSYDEKQLDKFYSFYNRLCNEFNEDFILNDLDDTSVISSESDYSDRRSWNRDY
jgi:translation initiation factor 2 beta subunit (eIF-2beta)/eIF-5